MCSLSTSSFLDANFDDGLHKKSARVKLATAKKAGTKRHRHGHDDELVRRYRKESVIDLTDCKPRTPVLEMLPQTWVVVLEVQFGPCAL